MGQRLPVRAQFTTLSTLATRKPLSASSPVMPLITASCSGPGGSAPRFQAMDVSLMWQLPRAAGGLFPLQRALAPFVDEPDRQHRQEGDHRPEAECADAFQGHGPGEQEGDLQVENNEQNCN